MKNNEHGNRRYMPGLDGLRTLAVFAVIAYHLDLRWATGGLLGVGAFFVLSGYLITDLLVEERQRNNRIDLKMFWIRRARRLLPAMLFMMLVVVAVLSITDSGRLASIKGDLLSALTYSSNWYLIFHDVSYFESFGPPSPIGHLWSLAVEEQFYLLWPLLLTGILMLVPSRGKVAMIILAGAALSFASMAILYEPGSDPSRVYYGTDTRAFGLLIGAALAIVWPSGKLAGAFSRKGALIIDSLGAAGLACTVYMLAATGEYDESLYKGGMVVLSVAVAFVIAAVASPYSLIGKLLGCKPLRWLGVRSYGIYLWHYPVIVMTGPAVPTGEPDAVRALLQVAASVALAAFSYKYVEEPIRRGRWKPWKAILRKKDRLGSGRLRLLRQRSTKMLTVSLIVMICISCTNGNNGHPSVSADSGKQPAVSDDSSASPEASGPVDVPDTTNPTVPAFPAPSAAQAEPAPSPKPSPSKDSPGPSPTAKPVVKPPKPMPDSSDSKPSPGAEKPVEGAGGITAIGDSVLLDAEPYLKKLVQGILIDGKVGRQMSKAQEVVDGLLAEKKLGNLVIIELGTNGSFTAKQMNKLIDTIGKDRRIVLVNTRVPRKWQDTVNSALSKAAAEHDNVTLIDWYAFSADKAEWFAKDGVHLKLKGAEAYAKLVADSLPN
ncbi:acyltransferase family protein [Cohnella faecalis]|uniref:Acetyltransferase n=1 Tax=Cohnella faecalis TaxID=2315694 RepID=A0A398CQ34_9BACL|nr:acyltransferase family protein [Cohnella faecalis]RIE03409.1 acetyltransferase [Cohnella faecalis]